MKRGPIMAGFSVSERKRIRTVLVGALGRSMEGLKPRRRDHFEEPDFVAWLSCEFPVLVRDRLLPYGLRLCGCYVHQKPKIRPLVPPSKRGCEIGDLLLVLRDRRNEDVKYRAALFQAKRVSSCTMRVRFPKGSGDDFQLQQYLRWPEFSWYFKKDISRVRCRTYKIGSRRPTVYSDYLFIVDAGLKQASTGFRCCNPALTMNAASGVDFSEFLLNFIEGRKACGSAVLAESKKRNEPGTWSDCVWDILSLLWRVKFSRVNLYGEKHNRLAACRGKCNNAGQRKCLCCMAKDSGLFNFLTALNDIQSSHRLTTDSHDGPFPEEGVFLRMPAVLLIDRINPLRNCGMIDGGDLSDALRSSKSASEFCIHCALRGVDGSCAELSKFARDCGLA